MSEGKKLTPYFIFYTVTALGSSLSSISAFLQIDNVFGSLSFLGIALATKTLLLAFLSPLAARVIKKLRTLSTLVISQAIGVLFLIPISFGFHSKSILLVILGISGAGLPSVFLGIVSTVIFKMSSESDAGFRVQQGSLQLLSGIIFLISTLISPLMLRFYSIDIVLAFDALTYIVGIIVLLVFFKKISKNFDQRLDLVGSPSLSNQITQLEDRRLSLYMVRFAIGVSGIYLLKGFIPIIAGSGHQVFTSNMPTYLRQSFWSVEAVAAIFAGWFYKQYHSYLQSPLIERVFIVNVLIIVPLLFTDSAYVTLFLTLVLSTMFTLGFLRLRDDMVSSFKEHSNIVTASGFAQTVSNLMMTISPVVVALLLKSESKLSFVVTVFIFQSLSVIFFSFKNSQRPQLPKE